MNDRIEAMLDRQAMNFPKPAKGKQIALALVDSLFNKNPNPKLAHMVGQTIRNLP